MKWIKIEVYLGVTMLVSALLLSSCVQVTVNFPTSGAVEDLEALAMNRVLSPSPGVPLQEVAGDAPALEVLEESAHPAPLPTGEDVQVIDSVVANDWILQGSGFKEDDRIVLTADEEFQLGAVWREEPLNLDLGFDLTYSIYLGASSDNEFAGGDGLVFVLIDQIPTGPGEGGGGIGYAGISQNSLGLEFDTYPDGEAEDHQDHLAINLAGVMAGQGDGPVAFGELENDQEHVMRVSWDPEEQIMRVYLDDLEFPLLILRDDLVSNLFGGSKTVFHGFTGSTGGAKNLQYVRPMPPALATVEPVDPNA